MNAMPTGKIHILGGVGAWGLDKAADASIIDQDIQAVMPALDDLKDTLPVTFLADIKVMILGTL
jgi:hypothetical protein